MSKAISIEEPKERFPRQAKNAKTIMQSSEIAEDENVEVDIVKPVGPRFNITGKDLDQNKMLKRKNCNNSGWVTLENGGQYPKQALVTLKTGLFEIFQNNFLNFMKSFSIKPANKDSIKLTKNDNGIERAEYDLTMDIDATTINLKVKIYHTKSSFDVQGLKPHFDTVFEALGKRTIAVYFVEVIMESIFQSIMNECNLEEYNETLKSQIQLGLENSDQLTSQNGDKKAKKVKEIKMKKCNICNCNTKELNSFKCQDCNEWFHKQCVNKNTSPEEFTLIKKGSITFNCENCIKSRLGINTLKLPAIEYEQSPPETEKQEVTNNVENEGDENKISISTQTDQNECVKCEKLESEKVELVVEMEKVHEIASKEHEKLELIVNEHEELKKKIETLTNDKTNSDGDRTNADLDRIKYLYEKALKDIAKLEESHKKEVKELVSRKLESDYRLDVAVKEKEKLLEKERILLNTIDVWKSKFDLSNETQEIVATKNAEENVMYECDECVYEASTQLDLKEHKKNIHEIKCEVCGHTVLTENDLKGHKRAYHAEVEVNVQCTQCEYSVTSESEMKKHKEIQHNEEQVQTIFMCNDCEKEFLVKSQLEEHMQQEHRKEKDFKCDKCEYTGTTSDGLENHRKSVHYYFLYQCGACSFETSNINVLKQHKQWKHERMITETFKSKVTPPPKCDLNNISHNSKCCDRNQKQKKPKIYTYEKRKTNGICLEWNKGFCESFELCKYLHTEIEACRYASYCSRSNCRFWHNTYGRFPFLENTHQNTRRFW